MCGIAGIVDRKGAREVDRGALKRMTDALAHRGPDGEGYFHKPGVGFGHRRLAIIDKAGGAQPFHTQSDRSVLSFNGEIYNYHSLAEALAKDGAQMRTRSDTEALAEGWERDGADFVHKLRGMFAVSQWDNTARRLTLCRDRLGERPLYYAETADGFLLFASEITALAASGLLTLEIDPRAAADYFFYGYVPDPKTIYQGIHKLPPGHILTAIPGQPIELERYWRPVFAVSEKINFKDACEEMQVRLDDAVSTQMISDVPLGAFLSGGVDSSGVVSSMAQTGERPITCSVGFDEASHDERAHARIIAEKYNTNHHEYLAGLDEAALIDDIAAIYGEPFADASALPSYLVAKLARQHVTVALSGDGGDEIFAGYRRYPFYLAEENMRALAPLPARRALFGPAGAIYPKLDWAPQPFRFKSTFQSLGRSSGEAYAAAVAINLPMRVQRMFSTDFKQSLAGYHPQSVVIDAMAEANTENPLAAAQYADLQTWLPGRMLTKVDRASMACSLEVRPPLLDHKLVEWAGLLPSSFKLQGPNGKRVLKEALKPRLGADFLARKKQGFAPPLTRWLRREQSNPLLRLNASKAWRESGVLDEAAIDNMARSHRRGLEDNSQELWSVIMFDAFLRNARRA